MNFGFDQVHRKFFPFIVRRQSAKHVPTPSPILHHLTRQLNIISRRRLKSRELCSSADLVHHVTELVEECNESIVTYVGLLILQTLWDVHH